MAEVGGYPNASTPTGSERILADQAGSTVDLTAEQISQLAQSEMAAAISSATSTAVTSATSAAAASAAAAAASASQAAVSAGLTINPVSQETSPLKGYAQLTDAQLPVITDSQDNPAALWDTQYEFFDGPMAPGFMRGAASQTNFPLATADQVTRLAGGGWNAIFTYGQSISNGLDTQITTALSTSQPYSNLTFQNGPRACTVPNTWGAISPTSPGSPPANGTAASAPLVENALVPTPDNNPFGGETPCSGAANWCVERAIVENLIAPTDFVMFASAPGHGGFTIAQLSKSALTTAWWQNLVDHVTKAKALATAAGKAFVVHAVLWMQGETDINNATTYATYKAALIQLQADIQTMVQGITGQSQPVHLLTYQCVSGGTTQALDQVLPAQIDACNSSTRIHFVGPHFFLPNSTASTGLHLSPTGYVLEGRYYARALKQIIVDQRRPDWLNPVAVYAKGQTVYVRYNVPTRPIVLDTELVGLTQNYGFRITDGTGDLTLSNIRVMPRGDTIAISINRALAASPQVRLGLDFFTTNRMATGNLAQAGSVIGTHNVRDSTKDFTIDPSGGTGRFDGSSVWFLSHWSPAFSAGRAADLLQVQILDPNS